MQNISKLYFGMDTWLYLLHLFRGTTADPRQEAFRKQYSHLRYMRSFFKRPFLCLTATANKDTTSKLRSMLQLQNPLIFRKSPEKMNIKLKVSKLATHDYSYFEHMGEMLANKELVEKTIIYCYNTTELSEIYATLCEAALDHYPDEEFPVHMFHRCIPVEWNRLCWMSFPNKSVLSGSWLLHVLSEWG